MENKKKIEKYMKVGKEILEVFRKNEIKPSEMCEILDNIKISIIAAVIDTGLQLKNK